MVDLDGYRAPIWQGMSETFLLQFDSLYISLVTISLSSNRINEMQRNNGVDAVDSDSSYSKGSSARTSSIDLISRASSLRRRPIGADRRKPSIETKADIRSPLEIQQREALERKITQETVGPPNHALSSLMQNTPSLQRNRGALRSIADGIPEVHFIGEICRGNGFSGCSISCRWSIDSGKSWSLLAGAKDGQSQYSMNNEDNLCIWNHPIDLHFTTANMKGWPRIMLQVWNLDSYGQANLVGYGFTHFPSTPGNAYTFKSYY